MDSGMNAALAALRAGDAVVFPTDTVLGLGVAVGYAASPDVLYRIKERPRHKPVAWLVADLASLDVYGRRVSGAVRELAKTFWPGPLTIIVHASDAVPEAFRSPEGTVGLRMPKSAVARELIERVGCPIATTSANLAGDVTVAEVAQLDPVIAQRAAAVFGGDVEGDGAASGRPSTVLDCSTGHPVIVREGAVTVADIKAFM